MEGSESEAVFDSLNLNPQLFINEVLNRVDDLVDGALDFFHQEASTLLKIEGTDRAQDLTQGVGYLRNMIQLALDGPMTMWEKYCLLHCFVVPERFSLPKTNESSGDSPIDVDAVDDTELDTQLDSLRDKLTLVGKESLELNRELEALEMQSLLSNHRSGSFNEALQLCEQYSDRDMFEEVMRTAAELCSKVGKLKTKRVEETECIRMERMHISNGDLFRMNLGNGLSNAALEELQEFITDIKSV